jgi:hypothetical protein
MHLDNPHAGLNDDSQSFARRESLLNPHHDMLQFMLKLAQNCQHRKVMEDQIRSEHGVTSTSVAVSIPESGVIPQTEDPLLAMMMREQRINLLGEGTALHHHDIASWVKDQEEDEGEQSFR